MYLQLSETSLTLFLLDFSFRESNHADVMMLS